MKVTHLKRVILGSLVLVSSAALTGCRGQASSEPPVHINPNMDTQDKYKPQGASQFFEDGRTMRTPVEGTVGRDLLSTQILGHRDDRNLREDDAYWRGQRSDGKPINTMPPQIKVDAALLARGQQRFNIYCAPCHDASGYGKGAVPTRSGGKMNVPSYHQKYMRQYPDGHIFDVISNGSASQLMFGYKHQIQVADRWAIVAYVRALQLSQNATLDDVPQAERGKL